MAKDWLGADSLKATTALKDARFLPHTGPRPYPLTQPL